MSLYLVHIFPLYFKYCIGSVIFMWRFGAAWCATFVSWSLPWLSWVWPTQRPWVMTWRTCLLSKDKVKSSHTEPTKSSHRLDKVQTVLTRWHCSEEFGQGQDTCPTLSPWNLGYSNLPPCSHPSHVKSDHMSKLLKSVFTHLKSYLHDIFIPDLVLHYTAQYTV